MSGRPDVDTTAFPLANGATMPGVGLGTWQGQPGPGEGDKLKDSIIHALKSGYRLLDTAQGYGVEKQVGDAVKSSGIPRSEISVVTKFFPYEGTTAQQQLDKSIGELGLDYVDVLLMHWPNISNAAGDDHVGPNDKPNFIDVWVDMQSILGPKCKAIGVSNFTQKTLDALLADPRVKVTPHVNQVELHALNPNLKLVPYCQEKKIHVMSWSTLGGAPAIQNASNPILSDELFVGLGKKYNVSPGVISLSWCVQRGVTTVPKSSTPSRIEDNIRLVKLEESEIQAINNVSEKLGKDRIANRIPMGRKKAEGKSEELLFGWTYEDFGWEDAKGNWLV